MNMIYNASATICKSCSWRSALDEFKIRSSSLNSPQLIHPIILIYAEVKKQHVNFGSVSERFEWNGDTNKILHIFFSLIIFFA